MLRDERMSAIMREPKTFNSWWVLNKVCGSTNLSSFRLFQERALIELPRIDAFPNATDQDKKSNKSVCTIYLASVMAGENRIFVVINLTEVGLW